MSWDGTLPISEAQVRDYLGVDGTTGKYSDALISSNIRAAASFLERETHRQFEQQTGVTKYFTSNGAASISIPDLRTITSITMQGAALTADESYWIVPDNRGVYTTLQLRPYGSGSMSYKANPEWFDRNLDRYPYGSWSSLPNDLIVTGDWGHDPYPWDFLLALKVLAGWYTRRPQSLLANSAQTPDGNTLDYSQYPPEVLSFIYSWKLGTEMVSV